MNPRQGNLIFYYRMRARTCSLFRGREANYSTILFLSTLTDNIAHTDLLRRDGTTVCLLDVSSCLVVVLTALRIVLKASRKDSKTWKTITSYQVKQGFVCLHDGKNGFVMNLLEREEKPRDFIFVVVSAMDVGDEIISIKIRGDLASRTARTFAVSTSGSAMVLYSVDPQWSIEGIEAEYIVSWNGKEYEVSLDCEEFDELSLHEQELICAEAMDGFYTGVFLNELKMQECGDSRKEQGGEVLARDVFK